METPVKSFKFGITITRSITTDGENTYNEYNVRIPVCLNGDGDDKSANVKDIHIEACNYYEACKIAELVESGGMVNIKNQL
jgi:hypothetical protein